MSDQTPAESSYTMGYGEEFLQLLDERSAQTHAARLLPHLKPGQRLLDFGCGPGTISVGLAKAVEPGEFHGIDMEESQIAIARSAAKAGGHANATFHVGDATKLPFADDYFDVAFCHTVLTHVPDTAAALNEARRVLKPGGLIFSREIIVSSSFIEPGEDKMRFAWNTFAMLLAGNGGHPEMGKELRAHFLAAGFVDVRGAASFDSFGTAQEVGFFCQFVLDWFIAPEIVEVATKHGLATREQFDEWRKDLDEWKDLPGGLAALAFGECMATSP
ncbi:MAG: methyltransferase domain-containing protein [Chloroflexi bacterium]|nr:methyltransferase domain-containing protein [Chloroflexota bacterium]